MPSENLQFEAQETEPGVWEGAVSEGNPPTQQDPPPPTQSNQQPPVPRRRPSSPRYQFVPAQWDNPPSRPTSPRPTYTNRHSRQYLPGRFDRGAPQFDGHPNSLKAYFEDMETLGRDCDLSSAELIRHSLRYLERKHRDAWESLESSRGRDWALFKKNVARLYPGSEDENRYTVTDLELFTEQYAATPMRDRVRFGDYYRDFGTISTWLITQNHISRRERDKYFLSGFHIDFRNQLRLQLRMQNPTHDPSIPWEIEEVEKAALYLINAAGSGNAFTITTPLTTNHNPPPSIPVPVTSPAPRETFDLSSLRQCLTSEALLSQIAGMIDSSVASRLGQSSPAPPNQPQRSYSPCYFCSDSNHPFRACQKLNDYLQKGLCIRNGTGRICLPNGVLITVHLAPGKNIKERIDSWYKTHPLPSTVQSHILEAAPVQQLAFNTPTSDEEELRILDSVVVATMKKQEEIRKRLVSGKAKNEPSTATRAPNRQNTASQNSNRSSRQPSSIPTPSTPPEAPAPLISSQPQYRFSTPIEDPVKVQNVIERSLDTTFPISVREFLASSSDARKLIKDQVTTRRIPTANVSALEETATDEYDLSTTFLNQHTPATSSLIVANKVEDLRTISLILNEQVTVDAILDEGSQISAVRRDVWEKLGLPLMTTETMIMESANASKDSTLGLLRDLPTRIGRNTFFLQVQVVENASYEMLLGRPFLTLTEARTHHYTSGESHITLRDPNTHDTFTIPTKSRVRPAIQPNAGF